LRFRRFSGDDVAGYYNPVDFGFPEKRGRFDLVANGNPMAGMEQFPQVGFKPLVSKPGDEGSVRRVDRQRKAKYADARFGIFANDFILIANPEHEDHSGMALFRFAERVQGVHSSPPFLEKG